MSVNSINSISTYYCHTMKVVFLNETLLSDVALNSSKFAKTDKKQLICDQTKRIINTNKTKYLFFGEIEVKVKQNETSLALKDLKSAHFYKGILRISLLFRQLSCNNIHPGLAVNHRN